MKKKGLFGILGTIFLIIILFIIGAIIYLYYFHVFETVRICLPERGQNTNITCQTDDECRGVTKLLTQDFNLSGAPDILSENFDKMINESIYCNETCFVRDTRGLNSTSEKFEFLDSCEENEIEIAAEIRGKEAIQLFKWIRGK